jgi:hypothetical protein
MLVTFARAPEACVCAQSAPETSSCQCPTGTVHVPLALDGRSAQMVRSGAVAADAASKARNGPMRKAD